MRKMANKKGFTIVELVIVIAVIAILAGVMIPTFSGVIEKANQSAREQLASAAYKDAYGVALSDGTITANEIVPNAENGFIFVFNANGEVVVVYVNTKLSANAKFKGTDKITVAGNEETVITFDAADADAFTAHVNNVVKVAYPAPAA